MIRLILGIVLAIAITTTFDATGLTNYSATAADPAVHHLLPDSID